MEHDDTLMLDWLEANPHYQLRKHKGHWSCARIGTNYPYSVFKTAREAIQWAMNGEPE